MAISKINPYQTSPAAKQIHKNNLQDNLSTQKEGDSFQQLLKNSVNQVDSALKGSERMGLDLASGRNGNLHETMLSIAKAEIGFQTLMQIRNKTIEAYQEVMRMQV